MATLSHPALILSWLKRSGWTQRQLAEAAGIDESMVHHLISGRRGLSIRTAMRLENGTVRARDDGHVKIAPLRAARLLPEIGRITPQSVRRAS